MVDEPPRWSTDPDGLIIRFLLRMPKLSIATGEDAQVTQAYDLGIATKLVDEGPPEKD